MLRLGFLRFSLFCFVVFFLFSSFVSAHPLFWHADELDRRASLAYAALNPYDAFEVSDFRGFSEYNCISLHDYNVFADSDPFDSADPITPGSAQRSRHNLDMLRRGDYNYLASLDPFDGLDVDDFDSYSDMECWTLSDYNSFSDVDRFDGWDRASLRDPDNFEKVIRNVGVKRYHFFDYRDLYDLR